MKILFCAVALCYSTAIYAVEMPDIDKPVPLTPVSEEKQEVTEQTTGNGLQEINESEISDENIAKPAHMAKTKTIDEFDVGRHDMLID